ncbi:MAG: DUF2071 domain-containing protein [Pyrinomonadaceae bacterium]|nr:DUF2071 domain-containing protein [Pyrinomonadaceae bacterium]
MSINDKETPVLTESVDYSMFAKRPARLPLMRQHWGKLLFMHWTIPVNILRPLVPPRLAIDTFEGAAYIAIVPFTMWGIRPSFAPRVPGLSAFHELNVRTYVHLDGVPGVWFLSLDANNAAAVWAARNFFHLLYFNARMTLEQRGREIVYASHRTHASAPDADFKATWEFGDSLPRSQPSSLEFFLTERYCLYAAGKNRLYRCRVFHQPWQLHKARLVSYESSMIESHNLPTPHGEPLLHYAASLETNIWRLERV